MLLVTGMTGHSGKFFLKELEENNYAGPIRCIVRKESNLEQINGSKLSLDKCIGDLNDENFLEQAMANVHTVIHIAGISHSVKIVENALKQKVKNIILVHTTGIYSKYKSASEGYKNIEKEINKMCENYGFENLIYLRPTMIYGNINDKNMVIFIKMVDKLRFFPVINKGKNLLQPVNGRDLGKAYYQLLISESNRKGDYILSGDKPISMYEMFQLISKQLKKRTFFVNVPLNMGVFLAKTFKIITIGKFDFVEKVQRMGENRSFSHEKAAMDFGYSPMPFEKGLQLEIDQYTEKSMKLK